MTQATCHVHSEWSYDGSWTLPRIAEAFGRRGSDVVLMSEHDKGFS
jgi:predicted metal-dependent phosphoesterase TrpH